MFHLHAYFLVIDNLGYKKHGDVLHVYDNLFYRSFIYCCNFESSFSEYRTYCNDYVTLILELLQRLKTFAAISELISLQLSPDVLP